MYPRFFVLYKLHWNGIKCFWNLFFLSHQLYVIGRSPGMVSVHLKEWAEGMSEYSEISQCCPLTYFMPFTWHYLVLASGNMGKKKAATTQFSTCLERDQKASPWDTQ